MVRMRIGELCKITFKDIERANKRILIRQAKRCKDRYVLLPDQALRAIEQYYRVYKPEVYLFESKQMKHRPLHPRSLQTIVRSAMGKDKGNFRFAETPASTSQSAGACIGTDDGKLRY